MLTKLDRSNLKDVVAVLTKHMEAAAAELGMKSEYLGGKFDALSFSPKFRVAIKTTEGTDAAAKRTFEMYCGAYGLKPEDLGRQFVSRGRLFKITGLNPSRPKYPVEARGVYDDKPMLFTRDIVSKLMPAPVAAAPAAIAEAVAPTSMAPAAGPTPALSPIEDAEPTVVPVSSGLPEAGTW